ncbi:hypothetical protein TNCV_4173621 [Trichonephila clavipes]|nr:hypothetical protein TNCV_4173621 [Trichonephila clavipes]
MSLSVIIKAVYTLSSSTATNSSDDESEPSFEEEILDLYGKDIDKVEHHKDKVSSHPFKSTTTNLAKKELENGIKCISLDEISVKSPDTSSMDFCAFGL